MENILLENNNNRLELSALGASPVSWLYRQRQRLGFWKSSQGLKTSGYAIGPVIGHATQDDLISFNGKIFKPGKHGFWRDSIFGVKKEQNCATFTYHFDPSPTSHTYPFSHTLVITYTLEEKAVEISFYLTNAEKVPMYFGAGLHPALALSTGCQIELLQDMPEEMLVYRTINGLVSHENAQPSPFLKKAWQTNSETFKDDAYFFLSQNTLPSDFRLRLTEEDLSHTLTATLNGWPSFGIWSKPGQQDFICLEPLAGVAFVDQKQAQQPIGIQKINGLFRLGPQETFKASLRLQPD